jgi:RNA polymerase sigma-70 factor (ECF subfamily)
MFAMPKRGGGEPEGVPSISKKDIQFTSIKDLGDKEKGPKLRRQLFAFALSLTKDEDWADEILQRTLEKAVNAANRGLFEEGTKFRSWLFKILQNTFYDYLRAQKVRDIAHNPVDVTEGAEDISGVGRMEVTPERITSDRQQLAVVQRTLEEMPDEQRVVIEMIISGMSYKGVAEALEIPIGTVMSRLSRAREILREASGREIPRDHRRGREGEGEEG